MRIRHIHKMTRGFVLLTVTLCAATAAMQAGTVQGVVLERLSGRPLSRTIVRLYPVPPQGSAAASVQPPGLTTRSGRSGHFAFLSVAPGLYIVSAAREGYFPAVYGQRLPIGRGTPVQVTADSDLFADLRLRHKGALTGRVLDENGVPAPGISVLAYRARLPLRSAGSGTSDDRGVYRIHGLDPGKYWIRSAGHVLDDGSGWLPTFGPQARDLRDARVHQVTVDADTPDTDVNPEPGTLFRLGGIIACDRDGPVTVTLSSETGRRQAQGNCKDAYRFEGVAPAAYEIFATMADGTPASGFTELFLDHDTVSANVQVTEWPKVEIETRRAGSATVADAPLTLLGRRQDLSETESAREIKGSGIALAPGHWEFRARAPAGQYVESIANMRGAPRRPAKAERPSDWFEVFIEARFPARIRTTISDRSGQISGAVIVEGKPVPGAPVFLWPVAESARRSLSGPLETLSDTAGHFRFESLPPGDYRVLASFDVNAIDEEIMQLSQAPILRAEPSQTATIDLAVWIAPW